MTPEIKGTSILIAGFGREGKSVLTYLESLPEQLEISIADANEDILANLEYPTYSGNEYLNSAHTFDTVIHSPGISKDIPELRNVTHLTSATNIFFSVCPGRIIGITGTKGKSTTSALIHHLLTASEKDVRLVGNIGAPALDELAGATSTSIFVMELSSYQLDDIHYSPHIAVVLPISQEHLPYHGTIDNYIQAKANITKFQNSSDYVVYAEDNEPAYEIANNSEAIKIPVSPIKEKSHIAWINQPDLLMYNPEHKETVVTKLEDLPLLGTANHINILSAITATTLAGSSADTIKASLPTFKSLEHRLEYVTTVEGHKYYNDSLATTPEATMHALQALPNTGVLLTGGFDRGLDYSLLGKAIADSAIHTLILFPDTGKKILESLISANPNHHIRILHTENMAEAVKYAKESLKDHETCLLSPASASFNLFKDYVDRGNQFKKQVQSD